VLKKLDWPVTPEEAEAAEAQKRAAWGTGPEAEQGQAALLGMMV
jgi:hypothetical protein